MSHGIQAYFLENARSARRVATLAMVVSVALLGALVAIDHSPVAIRRRLLSPNYIGFEGPEQYQERIEAIQSQGGGGALTHIGAVLPIASQRGGRQHAGHSPHPQAVPVPTTRFSGPGDAALDVSRRGSLRHADLALVRSEDLVFEHQVVAAYPPILFEKDIEGSVTLEVVVDTLGSVNDIQILASSGEPLFEQSATEAARQCRFRPYRRDGVPAAIVTRLRFKFTIAQVRD